MAYLLKVRPVLLILVIAMLGVALACAGEKATPTSPPTATLAPTATTAPTATLVPTATATLVLGEPTPTATAVPTVTVTAAPTATPRQSAATLTQLPGYKAEWGEPQRGGILKLGMPQNPNSFSPTLGGAIMGPIDGPLHNALVRYDPWVGTSSLIGDLAKSWEFSGDGLTLTFKLEEGVKFQDNPVVPADIQGGDFTCEDVQASIDYVVHPPEPKRAGDAHLQHITGVSCPDGAQGYTAMINLNTVLAKTLRKLNSVPMLDKEWIAWYVADHFEEMRTATPASYRLAMGTGPMVPLEFQPDVVAKTRRNPSYFREGLPLLDGMDSYILKDYTTKFAALATGQIHWLGSGSSSLLPGQVAQAERDFPDRIVIYSTLHTYPAGARFNLNRAPWNDRRVRQAINLAIDRDEWLLFQQAGTRPGAVLVGYMEPFAYGFYWGTPEEELRTWPGIRQPKDQDVAEANRLLDEVFGKGKRFTTSCLTRNSQNYMNVCLFLQDQVKQKLGIGSTMQTVEVAVLSTFTGVCNYDMQGTVLGALGGDPDFTLAFYSWAYRKGAEAKCNLEGMTAAEPVLQAEIEAMVAAQTGEMDQVKRGEMVRAIEKKLTLEMIHEIHFGRIILFYGTTPQVKGYTLVTPPGGNYSAFERTWLAK